MEADTVIFSIYAALRNSDYRRPVVVDAADTDIYVAAAHTSHMYPGDLLIKRKNAFVNSRQFLKDSMIECIIPMHCMTGCDANSGFFGNGKKKTFEKFENSESAWRQLMQCGECLEIDEEVIQDLMQFTRHIMYGDNTSQSMAEARTTKWKSLKAKNFSRLPPDEDSLRQHIKRANFLAYLIRHPFIKNHPSPLGHGWTLNNRLCRPLRFTKPALPDYLNPHTETKDAEQHSSDVGEYIDSDVGADTDCVSEIEYVDIDTNLESDDYSDLDSD